MTKPMTKGQGSSTQLIQKPCDGQDPGSVRTAPLSHYQDPAELMTQHLNRSNAQPPLWPSEIYARKW